MTRRTSPSDLKTAHPPRSFVKALRHYHDLGVLQPADVDPATGYRFYDTSQVTTAQMIRRLRDLGMPLDQIRAALAARALVDAADLGGWAERAPDGIAAALAASGLTPAGPAGALFPGDFFELERAEVTLFQPLAPPAAPDASAPAPGGQVPHSDNSKRRLPGGGHPAAGISLQEIPAVEAAVLVHEGAADGIDRTYGALGTAVAQRAIGVAGPIREYYLVGFADTGDESRHRTEVCWPVFRTAGD